MLCKVYPDFPWNAVLFSTSSKRSSQRWLVQTISEVFPTCMVVEEYTSLLEYPTGHRMEFDVFIPQLNVVLEYQGSQHYTQGWFGKNNSLYKERDLEKRKKCKQNNLRLVIIPYWWDSSKSSLLSLLEHFSVMDHTVQIHQQ
eukprot:TRINITY_DN5116_c1_g1_i5.p2 TRINITY_DN5116_c1_g1~~TRINITY_DN5116_c1_g1_i5.p2  ORF type:complete len:142 (-),score=16.44 TRINITY_DN5116_c1_g1_i5:197-622(-)